MDVIVVDDDPLILSLISDILKHHNYNVRAYSNAEEAWHSYQEEPVHFVVADLVLPGMSGIELVQKIRAHEFGDYSYLLVITVRNQPEDLQEVLHAGADDYLTKPVDLDLVNIRLTIARQQIKQLLLRNQIEKQLIESKGMAEAANRTKSQFMSIMTHELRTPLNAIVGFNDLLSQTTQLDQEQQSYCHAIHDATDKLLELVCDIMDYSQLELGKANLLSIPFDLELCIQEAVDSCINEANKKQLDILIDYHPKLPTRFLGDPKRIRRALQHLINNAIKFTQQGEVLVSAMECARRGNAVYVCLTVNDTGIGIAEEQHQAIFNDFTQVDNSLHREHDGTGIGLAVTQRLIQSMGGDINVESDLGKGSNFTINLPLIAETQLRIHHEDVRDLDGMSVLIMDDNRTNCKILRQYAEAFAMSCDEEYSLENAIDKCSTNTYDFALLDYDVLSAYPPEYWRQIKYHSKNSNIKLIFMCSTGKREIEASVKAYASAIAYKPIMRSQLLYFLTSIYGGLGESPKHQAVYEPEVKVANKPLQVLLVEDNDLNRKNALKMLSHLNCEVTESHHGLQAVQKMDERDFDLVLMDVRMPKMDGLEATRRIRLRGGTNTHVPIIAMTAAAMTDERERCLRAGMDDYLNKPIHMQELQSVIAKWHRDEQLN